MIRRVLLGVVAILGCALVVAPNASAGDVGGPGLGGPPAQTSTGQNGSSTSGGPGVKTVNACHIFSNGVSFGLSCGAGGKGGLSFSAILGGDPVPTCWDTPWTKAELDQANITADPSSVYVHRTCLNSKNIDADNGMDTTTNLLVVLTTPTACDPEVTWDKIPDENISLVLSNAEIDGKKPYDCVMKLTAKQQDVLSTGDVTESTFPYPALLPTPVLQGSATSTVQVNARVNQPVALFDQSDTNNPPGQVDAGGVQMRAVLDKVDIKFPDGDIAQALTDKASTTCSVIAQNGQTPESLPTACWYKFTRTSAYANSEAFNVLVTSTWSVQYQPIGGNWATLNHVTKYQTTSIKVGSVQALVVPN